MRIKTLVIGTALALAAFAFGQSPSNARVVNPDKAKWVHEANDPPGSETVVLHEDERTGALDLLVSYPAGHIFAPHSHASNERILLIEGRLAVAQGGHQKPVEPGGYVFLPSGEIQRLSCVSQGPCKFYVSWDGDPRSQVEGK